MCLSRHRFGDRTMSDKKVKIVLPKLFPRGKKGFYYFRRLVDGKDCWVNTKMVDLQEAKKVATKHIRAELSVEAFSHLESSASRLADTYVESLTGRKNTRTPISAAHQIWIDHSKKYNDVIARTRKYYHTIFDRFAIWCKSEGIENVEDVDHSAAVRYSKVLWESGLGGKAFNDHLKHLSRVFSCLDAITPLPQRDPFQHQKISRISQNDAPTESHHALEPKQLKAVIKQAAEEGRDFRDLIILGSQTGMRLKDAALLKWKSISGQFIEIIPFKTSKSGNSARIPISPTLCILLKERRADKDKSDYVLPGIAEHYQRNYYFVSKKCKQIFEDALGKEATVTQVDDNDHRQRNVSVCSFHSLRTTFMSLLASKDVSTRDAMRIMGWESSEMIQVYEKMLEEARGDSDKRALALVNDLATLKFALPPPVIPQKALTPTVEALQEFVEKYSNVTIGKVYGITSTAVAKWLKKFGIERTRRIESADISDDEILAIREALKNV